jgi:hypothetical protein
MYLVMFKMAKLKDIDIKKILKKCCIEDIVVLCIAKKY